MEDAVACAVGLAERQLEALERNDLEAFLAGEEPYAAACAAAARSPGAGPEAAARLQQLIQLAASICGQLDQLTGRASYQLGRLGRGRAAASAYLSAPGPASLNTHEG